MLRKLRKKKSWKENERQERGKKKRRERSWNEKKGKTKKKRKQRKAKQRRATKRAPSPVDTVGVESLFAKLDLEDSGQCSSCARVFSQEDED